MTAAGARTAEMFAEEILAGRLQARIQPRHDGGLSAPAQGEMNMELRGKRSPSTT